MVQASLLAAQRLVYRLHRAGIARGTSGSAALCGAYPMPVMRKSQYRWQMTVPVPATSPAAGCNPTGRSSVLWETTADVADAGGGGSCGSLHYCVGTGCETVRPQANTGFAEAAARLNMALELGGGEFDREDMAFFTGEARVCHVRWTAPAMARPARGAGLAKAGIRIARTDETGPRRTLAGPLSRPR